MFTNKSPKNTKIFECKLCHYNCSKKSEWNRHINTRKHKLLTNTDEKAQLNHICECGKSYKHIFFFCKFINFSILDKISKCYLIILLFKKIKLQKKKKN